MDSSKNQEEPNIESNKQQDLSSKDNSTLGLPTLNKTPEPNLLEPLLLSLNTLAKKPYYIMVLINKAKLKKKINGNIGE